MYRHICIDMYARPKLRGAAKIKQEYKENDRNETNKNNINNKKNEAPRCSISITYIYIYICIGIDIYV